MSTPSIIAASWAPILVFMCSLAHSPKAAEPPAAPPSLGTTAAFAATPPGPGRNPLSTGEMAAFWRAGGAGDLSLSALALAAQLSDPQHAVPGHPFPVALTSRSLEVARRNLRAGLDLRDPAARRARAAGWPA